jgi:hypothetical protein
MRTKNSLTIADHPATFIYSYIPVHAPTRTI